MGAIQSKIRKIDALTISQFGLRIVKLILMSVLVAKTHNEFSHMENHCIGQNNTSHLSLGSLVAKDANGVVGLQKVHPTNNEISFKDHPSKCRPWE